MTNSYTDLAKKYGINLKKRLNIKIPREIIASPTPINEKYVKVYRNFFVHKVSEEELVLSQKTDESMAVGTLILSMGISFYLIIGPGINWLFYSIVLPLIALFFNNMIYLMIHPMEYITLNRITGIITSSHNAFWQRKTINFNNYIFKIASGSTRFGRNIYELSLINENTNRFYTNLDDGSAMAGCVRMLRILSFITWFMDKNRPLPCGKIFDPYREKDYQRYIASGKPEPLYKYNIEVTTYLDAECKYNWDDYPEYKS